MARLGLDASRFAKGDPRDINHFFPIIGTNGKVDAVIRTLTLYSNGMATIMSDATGDVAAFDSHEEAIGRALSM